MVRILIVLGSALALLAVGASAAVSTTATSTACSQAERARRSKAVAAYRRAWPARRRAFFHTHAGRKQRRAFLARERKKLRVLERAVAACRPPREPSPSAPVRLPFFPQAGILWQDLYISNFVDLDPGPGVLDWTCGGRTYNTHTGEDSVLRSFQEQRLGVPVFAALDGRVLEVENFHRDENTAETTEPVDNHVVIDHGAGIVGVYGHLRRGSITVGVRSRVHAGEQIGLTGSSGNSTWPHLHFTVRFHGKPYEPFAGPCRPGASGWVDQTPVPTEPYVRDFTFSAAPFGGRNDSPWDEATRTGTFVAGKRTVYFRAELVNVALDAAVHVRVLRPDRSVAVDDTPGSTLQGYRFVFGTWAYGLDLTPGRWTLQLDFAGHRLVEAPFDVAAGPGDAIDRPPAGVTATLVPAQPHAGDVVFCRLATSLVREDPDYEIVRYRYRWTVDGRRVRDVTTAALSDAVPDDTARAGQTIACSVTPSDGRLAGPEAYASRVVATARLASSSYGFSS